MRSSGLGCTFACSLLLGSLTLAVGPDAAHAQSLRRQFWVPNSRVRAAVLDGNTLYIGGDFTQLGPVTGAGALIDATSGMPAANFPVIAGDVACALPDGTGGWFIGGDFTSVGGVPRVDLAHVLADGSVDAWDAGADGPVQALARIGGTLYVGGLFGRVGGESRSQIAALDAATGAPTAWDPGADGAVYTLAVSGNTIYAGGAFANIGGAARGRIAALDATTGFATAWNPNALPDYSSVLCIALDADRVYASGSFIAVGGQLRNGLAALDPTSGLATAWDPNPGPPFTYVNAIAPAGGTIYVGGSFSTIGGADRASLAALDAATAQATPWDPGTDGAVDALALHGSVLYAGGAFTHAGGEERLRAAAIDIASGAATAWAPDLNPVDATVRTLVLDGDRLFAGGTFTSAGGTSRKHLAAIDVRTGRPTDWNPGPDDVVNALALTAGTVYMGGDFLTVGGASRAHLAAVDRATGLVTAWDPSADRTVRALATDGGPVYAGGEFMEVGGQSRDFIAALDPATGAATGWAPGANGVVRALTLGGGTLYAGGTFTWIGGQTRNHIAALDPASGAVSAWNPDVNGWVGAVQLSGGGAVIAAGAFTGIGASGRNLVAAIDPGNGRSLWPEESPMMCTSSGPDCLPGVEAIAVNGTTIYAGGLGQLGRGTLAAVDAASGAALDWTPEPAGGVCALATGDSTLFVGGEFRAIAGEPRPFLAAFAVRGTAPVTGLPPGPVTGPRIVLRGARPNPSFAGLSAAFSLPDAAAARLEVTDLAGRRVVARDVGALGAGEHVVDLAEGRRLAPGVYLLRLTRGGDSLTSRAVVLR
jgi:beta-propeller uncharacterized protein DUF5122